MLSVQAFTRNLRLASSLRVFSSATVPKKPQNAVKGKENSPKVNSQSAGFAELFKEIEAIDLNKSIKDVTKPKIGLAKEKTAEADEALNVDTPKGTAPSQTVNLAERIATANTVNDLLRLSGVWMTQENAMAIVTKLSLWKSSNRVKVSDFENDPRFLKVCQILSKSKAKNEPLQDQRKSVELEMVLSIPGDDEAAEVIANLTLSQKVRVFSSLARKKSRSIVVLKALASTISSHPDKMNLKECSDLLFAMTSLNFIDEMLLSRISLDIERSLDKNMQKSAVVGSIVTSMGFLKFKDPNLLDSLTSWVIAKESLNRPKDLASFILTLALVNYRPKNLDTLASTITPKITQADLSASEWLDYVWALSVLELQQTHHLESVLRPEFAKLLASEQGTDVLPAQKMKILNVNAVASQLTANYQGPVIESTSTIMNCPMGYRKNKKVLIQGLLDTLKNLFTSSSHIRSAHDTKFGFVIDAECVLNESRLPLAVENSAKDAYRVAIMVLDYHDMCTGCTSDPNGFQALAIKILQKLDYKVLVIPHSEFKTSEKVVKRVQYLDAKLKTIVEEANKKK